MKILPNYNCWLDGEFVVIVSADRIGFRLLLSMVAERSRTLWRRIYTPSGKQRTLPRWENNLVIELPGESSDRLEHLVSLMYNSPL